jgi:hypothetical protein
MTNKITELQLGPVGLAVMSGYSNQTFKHQLQFSWVAVFL